MHIPYSSSPRKETRFYNAHLGLWLFIGADTMLFGSLFSCYVFLRMAAADWPEGWQTLPVHLDVAAFFLLVLLCVITAWLWFFHNNRVMRMRLFSLFAVVYAACAAVYVVNLRALLGQAPLSNFLGFYFIFVLLFAVHLGAAGAMLLEWVFISVHVSATHLDFLCRYLQFVVLLNGFSFLLFYFV